MAPDSNMPIGALSGPSGSTMAGILLYTAAPDSEGTLGGLVGLGVPEQLGRHLDGALEQPASPPVVGSLAAGQGRQDAHGPGPSVGRAG